eukprot:scaffold144560_cov28-Tisochrysis_lutea.AAC.3
MSGKSWTNETAEPFVLRAHPPVAGTLSARSEARNAAARASARPSSTPPFGGMNLSQPPGGGLAPPGRGEKEAMP